MSTRIKIFNIVAILIGITGCKEQKPKVNYLDDDGIMVEILDEPIDGKENDYTSDNIIYKEGRIFDFKYHFENRDGDKLLYQQKILPGRSLSKEERRQFYFLVPFQDTSYDPINIISMEVTGADYHNQSEIQFNYIHKSGDQIMSETTGVIENLENIWMHPPRSGMFKILELNPFPFVKFPFKKGTKWQWELGIGDGWSDPRWKEWEGSITNKYDYEITDKVNIKSPIGNLECYVIDGVANSRIGQTYLKSYFNEEHGFVKLEYTNIDSTKTVIELQSLYN